MLALKDGQRRKNSTSFYFSLPKWGFLNRIACLPRDKALPRQVSLKLKFSERFL